METINTNRNVVNPRDRNGDINPTILYTFKDEDTSSNQPTPHREDGPALIIVKEGTEIWFYNGRIHRDGGPSIIHPNGTEEWYRHGVRHRDDGPAVVNRTGFPIYWCWCNGREYPAPRSYMESILGDDEF